MPSDRDEMRRFSEPNAKNGVAVVSVHCNRLQIERNFPALSANGTTGEPTLFLRTGISGRTSLHLTIRARFCGANSGDRNLTPYSPDV